MSPLFVFLVIEALILQTVLGQCVNRVGSNQLVAMETLLPNQLMVREQVVPVAQNSPCLPPVAPTIPVCGPVLPTVAPGALVAGIEGIGYAPTIIQDGSVANSLAHTLQLLVVSSLLSNTLPGPILPGQFMPGPVLPGIIPEPLLVGPVMPGPVLPCEYPAYPVEYLTPFAPTPGYSFVY